MVYRLVFSIAILTLPLVSCQSTSIAPIITAPSAQQPAPAQTAPRPASPAVNQPQVVAVAPATTQAPAAYVSEIQRWRAERLQNLTKDDGWLTVAGLYWLKPGANNAGSGPNNTIIFPRGKSPDIVGTFELQSGKVSFTPRPNSGVTFGGKPLLQTITLKSDVESPDKPTVLDLNSLRFYIIKRGELMGVRIKDFTSAARTAFKGLNYFELSPAWRVEAKLEPHNPPKKISIVNVLGMTAQEPSPGALVFSVNGKTYRLDAVGERGADTLDIMFADDTNGRDTYGAGRYLDAEKVPGKPDTYLLDFNKSYSPPCSFTRFATCPLPPPQNRLKISVTAGEKNYAGVH
ncbi:MAG: DUF1684 domain-containing protein [Burkholderiales bacterium]